MTINKRYLRNIKENLSFYISIIFLTAIVIAFYIGIAAFYSQEKDYLDEAAEKSKTEDGQFTSYVKITDEEIEKFEKDYDVVLERQESVDIDFTHDGKELTLRVLKKSEKINIAEISEGKEPAADNEILINPGFADKNSLKSGDSINLGGKDYVISGLMIRYDYLICLKNYTDTFSNSDIFGIAMVSDEAFESFDASDVSEYYMIRYNLADEKEVRKALYERFKTSSYCGSGTNNRIVTPKNQIDELEATVVMILPVAILLLVILIAVVLGRKIKNEQKQLGVLNALGYRKGELARHYAVFGVILGVTGAVLGIIAGSVLIEPIADMCIEGKMERLPIKYHVTLPYVMISLGVPTVAYVLAIYITAMKTMSLDVIYMIKGLGKQGKKRRLRMADSRLSFRTKYRIRAIFGNLSRSLVVIFGLALGGLLLAFGYACVDSIDYYCDKSVEESGSFEYEYFLNHIGNGSSSDGEAFLGMSLGVSGYEDLVTLMGMDESEYIELKTADGTSLAPAEDKYYISEMCSYIYGVKKGDMLKLYDPASMEEYEIRVSEVFKNGSQNLIVSDNGTLCSLFGLPDGSYNGVISDKKLDFSEADILKTVVKKEISEQIKNNIAKSMHEIMGLIIAFGGLIAVITTYLMVNVLINESVSSISMLKVLGYHDNEVNSVVTHIYHFLLPLGIILGFAGGYWLNDFNFRKSTAVYNTYIEPHIRPSSVCLYIAIMLASYMISILLLNRKVGKISMAESIKRVSQE